MGQPGEDVRTGIESLSQAEANRQLERLEGSLRNAEFGPVNRAFDQYKASRKGGEPEWYKVAGK